MKFEKYQNFNDGNEIIEEEKVSHDEAPNYSSNRSAKIHERWHKALRHVKRLKSIVKTMTGAFKTLNISEFPLFLILTPLEKFDPFKIPPDWTIAENHRVFSVKFKLKRKFLF